ncbi:MAG: hypothetical protein JO036_00870 [Candidatus Eremiobacteraeota bacterium]|nr:hypothetical protein [Candidatus Eremiobacteraeota bacterium]
MARDVFNLLVNTGHVTLDQRTVASLRRSVTQRLRLELFLEILTKEISPTTIFKPFERLRGASSNVNHLAIVALTSRPIMTTNQDLLLEDAARRLSTRRRVIHLHGKSDNLSSIIAIVSQYLGGLDGRVRRPFEREVADGKVLVLGYSGRDRDVMQLIIGAKPRAVKWLLHCDSPVHPEVEHAHKILGKRMQLVRVDTTSWLCDHLPRRVLEGIEALEATTRRARLKMPDSVVKTFAAIPTLERNRALARILEHLGRYDDAKRVYEDLRPNTAADRARRLFALGRVEARVAGQSVGLKKFLRLEKRRGMSAEIRGHVLLNIADALRNTSRSRGASRVLARLDRRLSRNKNRIEPKTFWHLRGWSLNAKATISRLESRPLTAAKLYRQAERAFLRARDEDGHIAVLTWEAECQLMLGNFGRARRLTDDAIREAQAYAKLCSVAGRSTYTRNILPFRADSMTR